MEIKCKVKKLSNPRGKLLGTADIFFPTSLGEMELRGFKIMEGSKTPWISMPSESWTVKDEKKYRDTVVLPDALKAEVCKIILSTWAPEVPQTSAAA